MNQTPDHAAKRWNWTQEEEDYVFRYLPRHGHHLVAQKLGRSPAAVHSFASRRGVFHGDLPGYVRVAGLARRAGTSYAHVYQRAVADGVTHQLGNPKLGPRARPVLVPETWADQFLAELDAKEAGDELIDEAGWLTVTDLTRAWAVGKSTILRGLNGRGVIADLLEQEQVRTAQASGYHRAGRWIVEPYGADRVRRRLERDRNRARDLISTKSVAVEAGVSQTHAAVLGRDLGGELLFVHGRWMCHVTPEIAEVMRAKFRDGITPGKHRGRPRGAKDLQPRRKAGAL